MVFAIASQSETWTIHGARDNYLWVQFHKAWENPYIWEYAYWDYGFDQAYPEWADSGFYVWWDGNVTNTVEWRESWTYDLPDRAAPDDFVLGSPGPDYLSTQIYSASFLSAPGEYWIDFAPDGSARISTTQPADFGKWAWDGSINPSWVEPLTAKKQHGKGHGK